MGGREGGHGRAEGIPSVGGCLCPPPTYHRPGKMIPARWRGGRTGLGGQVAGGDRGSWGLTSHGASWVTVLWTIATGASQLPLPPGSPATITLAIHASWRHLFYRATRHYDRCLLFPHLATYEHGSFYRRGLPPRIVPSVRRSHAGLPFSFYDHLYVVRTRGLHGSVHYFAYRPLVFCLDALAATIGFGGAVSTPTRATGFR